MTDPLNNPWAAPTSCLRNSSRIFQSGWRSRQRYIFKAKGTLMSERCGPGLFYHRMSEVLATSYRSLTFGSKIFLICNSTEDFFRSVGERD